MTSADDLSALREIRAAAGIGPSTPIQRLLLPSIAELYLGNVTVPGRFEPHRTAGFVTRMQDVAARGAIDVTRSYGMDQVEGWPIGGPAFVLRFNACWPGLYHTSYGGQTAEGAARMNSRAVYPPPFLGTGYTNYAPSPIPEYFMPLTELIAGTELWRIDTDGTEAIAGRYHGRHLGWQSGSRLTFGPSRWEPMPAPLHTQVRRGLHAVYQQNLYQADFGPQPSAITLYPSPGQPLEGFEERQGTHRLTIENVECASLHYLRQRCTYRGEPFELIDTAGDFAVLNYLGENYQAAAELGLTEVDYRCWRTTLPSNEVGAVTEESIDIKPEGLYGRRT